MLRKKCRRKMHKKYSVLVIFFAICVCFLTIGYAILSTSLNIGGVTAIAGSTWDVHFDNIQVSGNVFTTAPVISSNTSIKLNSKLNPPNDSYKFLVDVVNDGTVDAKVKNVAFPREFENFELSVTYKNGTEINVNDLLKAGTKETLLVVLKYKENLSLGETKQSVEINIDYVQADELAKKPSTSELTVASLINLSNSVTSDYNSGIKSEMYAFEHDETEQLETNVDYRYIGGAYCLYDDGKKATSLSNGVCRNIYKYQAVAISASEADKEGYSTTCPSNDDKYTYSCQELQGEKIGVEPNNYIDFNGETWRIIGVFLTDNGDGTIENRLKIVKEERVSDSGISWDYKMNGVGSSTSNYGSNDWVDSQLMYFLNPDDIASNVALKTGYTFDGQFVRDSNNTVIYEKGKLPAAVTSGAITYDGTLNDWRVSTDALTKVDSVTYYLGGAPYSGTTYWGSTLEIYTWERGNKGYSNRPKSWLGKVGLMYPSDYAFTFGKGISDICYDNPYHCKSSAGGTPEKSWLYNPDYYQFFISPYATNRYYPIILLSTGYINIHYSKTALGVRPVVYLKPDVKLNGSGTVDDPYVIVE